LQSDHYFLVHLPEHGRSLERVHARPEIAEVHIKGFVPVVIVQPGAFKIIDDLLLGGCSLGFDHVVGCWFMIKLCFIFKTFNKK